ncbi:sulfur carrier protein ThiS [Bacillus sp. ISL-35]|uniref:sulfur carrier protein ThiS n=1 Tax=Bacillus sp. ISL-35 TaxID=2819122 RepID=UPI001BE58536|nr:sulfur carrier protein ThiS [Bacillus sp. ISL-35]MBT2680597.1 sulfur carrier protein ThiS [Bacillus sp. ISL-35]MBT2704108.1 sulfur carrier protein ThiS [Chryseobacterium sp. ISL-80]
MKVVVNGNTMELPDSINRLSLLLEHFNLEEKVVIIEQNLQIIDKNSHAETMLSDGDRIEIVHFVGGG